MAGSQGFEERLLINRCAPPNIIENRAALHPSQALGGNKMNGVRVIGQDVNDVVGSRKRLPQIFRGNRRNSLVSLWLPAHGDHLHGKRGEQLQKPRRNGAETQDDRALILQERGAFTKLKPLRRAVCAAGLEPLGAIPAPAPA